MKNNTVMTFDDLLVNYNSVQIMGLLGALQLHHGNHGRNFRFEQYVLQLCDNSTRMTNDPWQVGSS